MTGNRSLSKEYPFYAEVYPQDYENRARDSSGPVFELTHPFEHAGHQLRADGYSKSDNYNGQPCADAVDGRYQQSRLLAYSQGNHASEEQRRRYRAEGQSEQRTESEGAKKTFAFDLFLRPAVQVSTTVSEAEQF